MNIFGIFRLSLTSSNPEGGYSESSDFNVGSNQNEYLEFKLRQQLVFMKCLTDFKDTHTINKLANGYESKRDTKNKYTIKSYLRGVIFIDETFFGAKKIRSTVQFLYKVIVMKSKARNMHLPTNYDVLSFFSKCILLYDRRKILNVCFFFYPPKKDE